VLFVALMGWNVGLNAGGGPAGGWPAYGLALLGVAITMAGMLLPSCVLTYGATRWAHKNRELRAVRAFKAGMAPIVVALLMATGWLLTGSHDQPARDWPLWALTAAATLIVWRTRLHLLWLIGAGAALGPHATLARGLRGHLPVPRHHSCPRRQVCGKYLDAVQARSRHSAHHMQPVY
jgi:chromate transporter